MNGNGRVTFGAYTAGNGCSGSGICDIRSQATEQNIPVSFTYNKNNPTSLIMSFRLSELKKKQPEQVKSFTSGQYRFDAQYPLSDGLFAQMGVPKGAVIAQGTVGRVAVRGDMVATEITIQLPRQEGNLSFTGNEEHWQDFR